MEISNGLNEFWFILYLILFGALTWHLSIFSHARISALGGLAPLDTCHTKQELIGSLFLQTNNQYFGFGC